MRLNNPQCRHKEGLKFPIFRWGNHQDESSHISCLEVGDSAWFFFSLSIFSYFYLPKQKYIKTIKYNNEYKIICCLFAPRGLLIKGLLVLLFQFNRLPYFLSAGWPVLKLVIRQCLGIKGRGAEIVSFVLFMNCSFYQNQLTSCFNFWSISPKKAK